MSVKKFEDLEVWKHARQLTNEIYEVTGDGSFSKDYGLIDQIRRASVSIMSNIAEGFERDGNKEFIQFLYIAKGSCGEVRSQLYLAFDQGYIVEETHKGLNELSRIIAIKITNFIKVLKTSNFKGIKFKKEK